MSRTRAGAEDVTAVIVSFNNAELTKQCVEALSAAHVPRAIIWDNSTIKAESYALRALMDSGSVEVLSDGANHGFGAGNNRAVAEVESEYVLLVNPDCLVNPDTVGVLRDVLADAPDIGIVAPRMMYPDGTYGYAGGPRPSMLKELAAATRIDERLPPRVRRTAVRVFERVTGQRGLIASVSGGAEVDLDWVSAFCVLLPTAVYRSVAGFDERFFLYFEDVDLCERIRAAGYRVVLARQASALHYESTSTSTAKSEQYWRGLTTYFIIRGARFQASLASVVGRVARS